MSEIVQILRGMHNRILRLENLGFHSQNQEYELQDNEVTRESVAWYLSEIRIRYGNRTFSDMPKYASIIDDFNKNIKYDYQQNILSRLYLLYNEEIIESKETHELNRNTVDLVMSHLYNLMKTSR